MENTTTPAPTLISSALKNGAILGVISIAITLLLYVADYTLMADWKVGLLSFAIFIGYAIYAGINYRKEIGGFIDFGKAFQHGFIIFAVSALISTLFNIVLYTVVDPELPSKLTEASVEAAAKMMENFGMPEEQMDEALEKTREDTAKRFTVGGLATGYLFALIFCAIFALITGAIVKKKVPEVM
jgi:Na+/H+-dicarboxylate symporter